MAYFCTTQNRVYCFYCRSCIQENELQFAKCLEPAFITDGFKNWKKAISKFQSHQLSSCHREAMFKFKRRNTPGIGSQLNDQVKKVQAVRREMFLKQLSTLRMLLISRNWRSKGLRGIRSLRNSVSIENVLTHS